MKQKSHSKKLDLTDQKFGRLIVIKPIIGKRKWVSYWLCKCDCGGNKITTTGELRSGSIHSCGCFKSEETIKRLTKHNESRLKLNTKEYRSWCSMKERCLNRNNKSYSRYGGRGIKISKEWINSYTQFLKDVGRAPSIKHTLDRYPDNNGNYTPGNVRWATPKQQSENRKSNVYITHNGEKMTLSQWSERLGLKQHVFNNARNRGKSLEQVLLKHINK